MTCHNKPFFFILFFPFYTYPLSGCVVVWGEGDYGSIARCGSVIIAPRYVHRGDVSIGCSFCGDARSWDIVSLSERCDFLAGFVILEDGGTHEAWRVGER